MRRNTPLRTQAAADRVATVTDLVSGGCDRPPFDCPLCDCPSMPLATAATGATAALKAAKLVVAPPTATKPLHLVEKADAAEKPEAAGAAAPGRRESTGREGDRHTRTHEHGSCNSRHRRTLCRVAFDCCLRSPAQAAAATAAGRAATANITRASCPCRCCRLRCPAARMAECMAARMMGCFLAEGCKWANELWAQPLLSASVSLQTL